MITMSIGEAERRWTRLADVDEPWIAQQITRRQRDGRPVCVNVQISEPDINVGLQAGQCGARTVGWRPPTELERRVLELWDEHVSRNGRVDPGDIIAFFHRLRRWL